MYIFSCKHQWEDMLTCIYEAWCSRKGQENIKLVFEPIEQYSLFDEYQHVGADIKKAESVINAIKTKISPYVYNQLLYASMAYEEEILDIVYRVLLLGFKYGPSVLNMVQYKDVMEFNRIHGRVSKEVNRFQEIMRFHEVRRDMYVAHFEPKSRIIVALGPIFEDRMPSENFIIVDDVHKEAIVHSKDEGFYLKQLSSTEYNRLLETENMNDEYTDMWKVFFDTIAIKERHNKKCQMTLFPVWSRKHAVEFL